MGEPVDAHQRALLRQALHGPAGAGGERQGERPGAETGEQSPSGQGRHVSSREGPC